MKTKFMAILAAFTLVFAFSMSAGAQTMLTDDVAFLKLGYSQFTGEANEITSGGTVLDDDPGELEGNGYNLQGEYNMNMGNVLIGFGLEYTYMTAETDVDFVFHWLTPMVSAKFITAGGFYIGAGLAGKYLMGQSYESDDPEDIEFDKEIDLWVNGMIGFMTPIQEFVYLDIEGRFGYNVTNNQFKDAEFTDGGSSQDAEFDMDSQYDLAIYVGVGYRVAATGF